MAGRSLGTFDLFDRRTKSFAPAELQSSVAQNNIDDFQDHWRPMFDAKHAELKAAGTVSLDDFGAHDLQDAHWKWVEKALARQGKLDCMSFAVEGEGTTQGLMFVRTAGFAIEPSQSGKPLVLIDLLATAPWNRPRLTDNPRFKGVGRLLLAAAISLSVDEEFGGRIGLHALPRAESWYRDVCRMTALGVDGTGMQYFEMTEAQADAFLGS